MQRTETRIAKVSKWSPTTTETTDDDTKPQIVSSLHSSFQGQKTNTPPNFPKDINGRLDKDQKTANPKSCK